MKYLVLFVLLVGCSEVNSPKFKVGDCIDSPLENEFSDPHHYRKILKVGKRNYLYRFGKYLTSELSIELIDGYSTKVDCNKAGF